MSIFAGDVTRLKSNLRHAVPTTLIDQVADAVGLTRRQRVLTPAVTTHLALRRALEGGTAISHLRHLTNTAFTPSAYCRPSADSRKPSSTSCKWSSPDAGDATTVPSGGGAIACF